MRKVITYGTFDLLHKGHIALLERAKALGDYLIVGVTSDQFDKERGKINVCQSTIERVDAVRATGLADLVIIEEYEGQKIEDIQRYDVDIFTVGSDWKGYFDYLSEWCEVKYLKRTRGVSSTQIRQASKPAIRIGVVAEQSMQERFKSEILAVSGLDYIPLRACDSRLEVDEFDQFSDRIDAVVLACPFSKKMNMLERAVGNNVHVLYVPPAFPAVEDASRIMKQAAARNIILQEGLKTAYFPAFRHLMLILESGRIGEIRDVELSCSQIPKDFDLDDAGFYESAMLDWGALAAMPIGRLLGVDPLNITFNSCYSKKGSAYLSRCQISYPDATASFTVGKGIKTEGDMVITGTKGYVYVPSPWWLTDYFEIRYEDLTNTRKQYWEYAGEGFRYELLEFVRRISGLQTVQNDSREHLWSSKVIEEFIAANA